MVACLAWVYEKCRWGLITGEGRKVPVAVGDRSYASAAGASWTERIVCVFFSFRCSGTFRGLRHLPTPPSTSPSSQGCTRGGRNYNTYDTSQCIRETSTQVPSWEILVPKEMAIIQTRKKTNPCHRNLLTTDLLPQQRLLHRPSDEQVPPKKLCSMLWLYFLCPLGSVHDCFLACLPMPPVIDPALRRSFRQGFESQNKFCKCFPTLPALTNRRQRVITSDC